MGSGANNGKVDQFFSKCSVSCHMILVNDTDKEPKKVGILELHM